MKKIEFCRAAETSLYVAKKRATSLFCRLTTTNILQVLLPASFCAVAISSETARHSFYFRGLELYSSNDTAL